MRDFVRAVMAVAVCVGMAGCGASGADDGSGAAGGAGAGGSRGKGGSAGGGGAAGGSDTGSAGASSTGGLDGGSTGSGGSGGSGPACTGVTGKFMLTATRSTSNSGSCPESVEYDTNTGVTITSQKTDGGTTYKVELSSDHYSSLDVYGDNECTANVSGCHVSATCNAFNYSRRIFFTSELSLDVTNVDITGTDNWREHRSTSPYCSANWNVTGIRQ